MADSRPEPGPLTLTSISLRPNLVARSAATSAARWAANGVLLRLPLNPTVPAEAKQRVSPLVSVMVTIVLLKVDLICATPRLTFLRAFFFLVLATVKFLKWVADFAGRRVGMLPNYSARIFGLKARLPAKAAPLAAHFLDALLACNSLARTLACARIRSCSLSAHGQAAAMPGATVAADVA